MKRVRWRTTRRASGRTAVGTAVLALGLLVSGCGTSGYTPSGPFRPLPEGAPPEVGPPTDSAPGPAPQNPADPGSQQQAGDPDVVADHLAIPTGLVVLPDGTAIVGERATGRLLQVFPDRSPARLLMTVGGIDATGDGGLLGLALSPTFAEDGLLYAYVSTATDNRVVRFPIGGTPNPVLTGIPHGAQRNGGGLMFAADGTLYVGTGDTGNQALPEDPASLGGKVLHVDVFGRPAGNGPVFARGLSDATALCQSGDGKIYATDDLPEGADELNRITENADYGWPASSGVAPVTSFPPGQGGLAGCTVATDTVFLGSLDGQRVDVVPVKGNGPAGKVTDVLAGKYGRLRTVVADAGGGLWITTSNRDGIGTPADDDDKVLRIVPPTSGGSSPL